MPIGTVPQRIAVCHYPGDQIAMLAAVYSFSPPRYHDCSEQPVRGQIGNAGIKMVRVLLQHEQSVRIARSRRTAPYTHGLEHGLCVGYGTRPAEAYPRPHKIGLWSASGATL